MGLWVHDLPTHQQVMELWHELIQVCLETRRDLKNRMKDVFLMLKPIELQRVKCKKHSQVSANPRERPSAEECLANPWSGEPGWNR